MAELHTYRVASRIVRKAARRLTELDRLAMQDFLESTRRDQHRWQAFRTWVSERGAVYGIQESGKVYHALDDIESALIKFTEREPIRSTLRERAIHYVDLWLIRAENEQKEYEQNVRKEKVYGHMLAHRKPKRRVLPKKKKTIKC